MRSKAGVRAVELEGTPSPLDLLVAVSEDAHSQLPLELGTGLTSLLYKEASTPSHPSKQSTFSQDGGTMQRLRDPLAEQARLHPLPARPDVIGSQQVAERQENKPEGIGTSGGGESGDTGDSLEFSNGDEGEKYPKEEGSEVHTGPESTGCSARSPRRHAKRQRMVWTAELHERFLNAVNHLGMPNAVPKTILRMMNVEGMTRENVASHLQKYRLHLKRQFKAPSAMQLADKGPSDSQGSTMGSGNLSASQASDSLMAANFSAATPSTHFGLSQGEPALGLPVSQRFTARGQMPLPISYIPPQAWAAGVPGYDALQAIQKLSGGQQTGGLMRNIAMAYPGLAPAGLTSYGIPQSDLPTAEKWDPPIFDIAPLSTAPPISAAAPVSAAAVSSAAPAAAAIARPPAP